MKDQVLSIWDFHRRIFRGCLGLAQWVINEKSLRQPLVEVVIGQKLEGIKREAKSLVVVDMTEILLVVPGM